MRRDDPHLMPMKWRRFILAKGLVGLGYIETSPARLTSIWVRAADSSNNARRIVVSRCIATIRGLREYLGACQSRSLAVIQRLHNTHLDDDRAVGNDVALADRKAALSGAHLNSVIGNAQSNGETESLAEPFRCHARIGV
jgi:hypothetical protein